MKFKLENFKPVNSAEIKVNDLTLIFGDNNTGKTYIAYALYGLLKMFMSLNARILTEENLKSLSKNGKVIIDKNTLGIQPIIEKIVARYSKHMSSEVFSNDNQIIPKITLSDVRLSTKTTRQNMNIGESKVVVHSDKDRFEITVSNQEESLTGVIYYEVNELLTKMLFDIPNVFISVSERLGISLFQKDLDLNINTLVDHIKKSKEINPFDLIRDYSSRYAMPVKHNIDFMRAIETIQKQKSSLNIDLSKHIKDMFGGSFKHDGSEIRFFQSRGNNKFNIPLQLASASVRALSNLYFFLKHKAKAGDLIIIDEPESHLSLKKQRLLAKLIADCMNHGLKIMLTTHSDTLVLELNNLIMLNSDFNSKDIFMKKHKYGENHIINPDNVNAYITKDGGVIECDIDKYGIEVDSMDKAIDDLNTVRDGLEARL